MQLKDQSYTFAVGTRLRVVQPNADTGLKKGDIVEIVENRGDNCPDVVKIVAGRKTGDVFGCFWHRVETLDDSPETRPTPIATQYEDRAYPSIAPGTRFVLIDAVGITRFAKGDVLELSKNDGSSFPFFKKVERGVKVGRGYAIKWRRLAPVDLVAPAAPPRKGDSPTTPAPVAAPAPPKQGMKVWGVDPVVRGQVYLHLVKTPSGAELVIVDHDRDVLPDGYLMSFTKGSVEAFDGVDSDAADLLNLPLDEDGMLVID